MKSQKYVDMLLEHQQHLLQEFFDISEKIRYKQEMKLDSDTQHNAFEILEENLEEVMNSSEAYAKIDVLK
jgi:hypothetical protein